ncbi:MAG: hypothetical protein H8J66_14740 [Nitrospira sp.]|nr:hypothetical protein [Nitrospira sp.]
MRTAISPKTGMTWRICDWNDACQMPVTDSLTGGSKVYCRWHRRCLEAPVLARDPEAFQVWLEWLQKAYPSDGWWSWPSDLLWPVMQGVATVWSMGEAAA